MVLFEAIPFEGHLVQLGLQLLNELEVFFVLLLENGDIFFLALAGVLGRGAVAFELLFLGDGLVAMFEVRRSHVVILLFNVLSLSHKLSHLVTVKYFLLLPRSPSLLPRTTLPLLLRSP